MKNTDHPGVVAPPPLIYLVGLIAGWGLQFVCPARLSSMILRCMGVVPLVAGIALIASAIATMRRANTHVEPWKPSTAVVADGPYAFSRNPIYVGLTLIYLGLAFLGGFLTALVTLPIVLLVMSRGVIAREERYLETKFGEEYRRYKNSVRRWI